MAVFFTFALFASTEANAASSTKTAKVYTEVIKSGNTAYCSTGSCIYKVKLKNKKAVSKKRLVKCGEDESIGEMKLKGSYLYYTRNYAVGGNLRRVNVKTGKKQDVIVQDEGYFKGSVSLSIYAFAFKGNKLYARVSYDDGSMENYRTRNFVSKLSGKSIKKSSVRVKNKKKATNVSSYKLVMKEIETGDSYDFKYYLKTPAGELFLRKN